MEYEAKRPDEGFDSSGARYEVTVEQGYIQLVQEGGSFGRDIVSALSPEDAQWLSKKLREASKVAEGHPRWRVPDTEPSFFTKAR